MGVSHGSDTHLCSTLGEEGGMKVLSYRYGKTVSSTYLVLIQQSRVESPYFALVSFAFKCISYVREFCHSAEVIAHLVHAS